jgi:allantoinase
VQLARKREAAAGASVVDYAFWGGLVDNNLDHLSDLHAEGVIGYKAFMSNAGTDFARVNDDVLYMGLKQVRDLGNVVGLHAENEFVNAYLAQQFMNAGKVDTFSWTASRPPEGELEAINRAIFWAKVADARLHIVHVSIAEGMRAVARARYTGAKVTAETCPHYLLLDSDDFAKLGAEAKCAPPIRPREEVEALWECVLSGLVDTIASDHSPCPIADKQRGAGNIWEAWGGITGIQTMLPAMLTEGVHRRGLDLTHLARLLSTNPARIFGVYPKKGVIAPGADADFVVVDLDKEWTLSAGDLFSRNKHSALVGRTFRGSVERTIVRGVTVYQAGEIVAQPGYGRLVLRQDAPMGGQGSSTASR